jgi:aminopeptidase N
VSPSSKDDWWITDGFSRYAEAMYVEQAAGTMGLEEAVKDMSVGALAYDTVPLSSANKLDVFSPEFQTLVTDKGAMILHMLRWVMGDAKYYKTMRAFASAYAGKSASITDFQTVAEKDYGDKLTWFFTQWLDSTGAPEFKTKYTVTVWAATKASAWARSRRISTCSACQSISKLILTARPKKSASRSWARILPST